MARGWEHYDVSNGFYRSWLDERTQHSCAYFEAPDVDLGTARRAKLEHICRKLRHWVSNLQSNRQAAIALTDEVTYRIWRLYMTGCAYNFERGGLGVCQSLPQADGGSLGPAATGTRVRAPSARPRLRYVGTRAGNAG